MAGHGWTEQDIADQSGRTVLITGANSGLGLRTAQVLAGKGARVLLACRSAERGARALREVAAAAGTEPELVRLDLADLASVRDAAARVRERTGDALDILVNNAGLMGTPRGLTADGFETQFGTNHLGHAALTWLLMPALRGGTAARVVTVSSLAARGGRLDLRDPNFEHRRYNPATAYSQAKLANQVFAAELDRRLRAAGEPVLSAAAHPGYSDTGLASAMARSQPSALLRQVIDVGTRLGGLLVAQNARMGALPQLYAATAPGVRGGDYVGPRGPGELRGHPRPVRFVRPALDPALGAGLWELTAKLTGVTPDPA
ncbi:oxidoreductase [Prauserella muralis]|uniref:Protochlorophyllide oxidoreductase n=1 Tax=Prauserella muralis TaxID=588067 RepID=A0A2V4AZ92_9PSEU|nr:oxidoreductase [Prauserella muralis]PXY27226.1 protochlorophyllide oxidoreductase [Prauserella muralis]TWE23118.1 NAD(P)-dependent dehydrogenase (short-subunit alcohol dehydrogenase family) [Prauserella muralis]